MRPDQRGLWLGRGKEPQFGFPVHSGVLHPTGIDVNAVAGLGTSRRIRHHSKFEMKDNAIGLP
jgi:hypothetical protein